MRAICEGCGRVAGEREVYCAACGRSLPGREPEPSDATPPGWLVTATPGGAGAVFEPLPSLPVIPPRESSRHAWPGRHGGVDADGATADEEPARWAPAVMGDEAQPSFASPPARGAVPPPPERWAPAVMGDERQPSLASPPARSAVPHPPDPRALELVLATAAAGLSVDGDPRPPAARAVYLALLTLCLASSAGAVILLVLHVVLHR